MTKRIVSAFLAIMMLVSFLAACSSGKEEATATTTTAAQVADGTSASETPAETEAPAPTLEDILGFPEEDNGGREITILSNSNQKYEWSFGEQNGEVVNDATYARDTMIEEYLGIKFNIILEDGNSPSKNTFNDKVVNAINAGDDIYDMVNTIVIFNMLNVTKNVYLEGGQLPDVNFDNEWWLSDMYDRYGVAGKVYCFMGDYSLSLYKDMSVIFFNRNI